jgi:hypothetical protein
MKESSNVINMITSIDSELHHASNVLTLITVFSPLKI